MKNLHLPLFSALVFIAAACSSKVDQSTADTSDPVEEPAVVKQEKPAVCIWKAVGVRETPEDKGKYLTTIYLGEKVTALGDTASELVGNRRYQYLKLRLIDDTEGWVRSDFVAVDATPGAMLKEATIYKRPDMMTSTEKSFNQMDFVAISNSSGDGWAEVIGKRLGDAWFSSGWVKSENLTTQPTDVAFSVFYTKAMEIEDEAERHAEIAELLQNTDLSSSTFYTIVAEMQRGGGEVEGEEAYVEE